jgi:hypothetical protein
MTHLDPDRLADRALGTDDPLTVAEEKHLNSCAECRDELAQLSRYRYRQTPSGDPSKASSPVRHPLLPRPKWLPSRHRRRRP